MADISIDNLIKSFEIGNNVLDGLSFTVNPGEHVAVLGCNGCGKTTLLKILTGEYDYDEGTVSLAPGKRIGLISQLPVFPIEWTTYDVLRSSKHLLDEIEEKMKALESQMESSSSPSVLREYDRLQSEFISLNGYDKDTDIARVANGLDITQSMLERPFDTLSGGEKTRVNLARLILEDTDILLLDEPTNHLDLHATEWLENYISHFKGTVLVVSHDRYFLDKVSQRCIEIVNGKAEFYSGNYSFYVEERQRRFDEKMRQYEKDQAKLEQLQRASDQLRLWAFLGNDHLFKRAFSMEKRIEKLKTTERPSAPKTLSVKFKEADFCGDEALVLSHISKQYGEKKLFEDLSLVLTGSESLAITGDNGCGKSTLLSIIMGQCSPDSGWSYMGPQIKCAFLPQIVRFENEHRSLIDTMLYECNCTPQQGRDRLASFGFRGEKVLNEVGNLSGGERSRLKLCMLMGGNINLLILDEPTNHLDIASREWIENALSDYDKTLIFVSHDRYFIDKFATRVLAFDGNGILTDYKGTYKEYTEFKARQSVYFAGTSANAAVSCTEKSKSSPSRPRRTDSAKAIANIESKIQKLENKISELDASAQEFSSDYVKLLEIEQKKAEISEELDSAYQLWEQLMEDNKDK